MSDLIKVTKSKRYPGLFVKKYKRKVFYDNLWNDDLIECRGKVELEDGTPVIFPFTKIFNRNENNTDIPLDERCLMVSKINGFMAAATYVEAVGEVVVSTTGSLDSDYVAYAEEYITPDIKEIIKRKYKFGTTWLFEIVHPDDPHIIEEKPGAYLIGSRDHILERKGYYSTPIKEVGLDNIALEFGVSRPNWRVLNFDHIVEEVKTTKSEGVVVYSMCSDTVLKIKSPYYLAAKAAARVKDISKVNIKWVDEEFYPLIEYLKTVGGFSCLAEQDRLELIRKYYL